MSVKAGQLLEHESQPQAPQIVALSDTLKSLTCNSSTGVLELARDSDWVGGGGKQLPL